MLTVAVLAGVFRAIIGALAGSSAGGGIFAVPAVHGLGLPTKAVPDH